MPHADHAPTTPPSPTARAAPVPGPRRRPDPTRRATLVIAGVAVVIMSVVLGVTAWSRPLTELWRVDAIIIVPAGDAEMIQVCAAPAEAHPDLHARTDVDAGMLELWIRTPDRAAGEARLRELTGSIQAAAARSAARSPTDEDAPDPARQERQHLRVRLREIGDALAVPTSRPAGDDADEIARAIGAWQSARAKHEQVRSELVELERVLASPAPDASQVELDVARVAEARRRNHRLQADLDASERRQAELTDVLVALLARGDAEFEAMSRAATEVAKRVARRIDADHLAEVDDLLQKVSEAVARCAAASSALADVWREQRDALVRPGPTADPLAAHALLARAADDYLDETAEATGEMRAALASLARGSGETTRRLVLQRRLAEDLDPLLEATRAVAERARSVRPTHNIELEALTQQLTGLRAEVARQESQLETALRDQVLRELRAEHGQKLARARAQRQRVGQQADELERALMESGDRLVALKGRPIGADPAAARERDLLRERGELLTALVNLEASSPREPAEPGAEPEIRVLPLRAIALPSEDGARIGRTLLAAVLPVGAGLVIIALAGLVGARRRGHRSIDACTRALQAARHAS